MRTLITILFTLLICTLQAQEKPWMRCTYLMDFIQFASNTSKVFHDEMVLDIGKNSSAFYSIRSYNQRIYTDSLVATGMTHLQAAMKAAEEVERGYYDEKIYKDIPRKGELTLTNSILLDHFLYTVPIEIPQWTLLSEQKEVAGYTCKQAKTHFKGRTWKVWYAPEIPIANGPWKLGGLPGLILDAEDTEGDYHFYCVGLKETNNAPIIEIKKEKYIKCTPQKYKERSTFYKEDVESYVLQSMGKKMTVLHADGTPAPPLRRKYNYIEK